MTGGGFLALTKPWPAMLRGIYGDPERYVKTYFCRWGDAVLFHRRRREPRRGRALLAPGRVDDVMNFAGHRLGTMEVESALVDHPDRCGSGRSGGPTS